MTSNIFYLLGIEPAVDPWKFGSRSSMLSLIGIEGVRVEFPLTRGLVFHATLCGITAVTVWFSRERKLVKLATYFASIFGILMTHGSRSEQRRVGKEGFSTCGSRWSP